MSFAVTQLVGFGGQRRSANPSCAYVSSTSAAPNSATHTFNTVDIGAEASNRKIIVAASWSSAADQTISTLTVNSVSAAASVAADSDTGSAGCALWIADVPTGTSVTVVIEFSGTVVRGAIGIFRVVDLNSSTVYNSSTDTAASSGVVSSTINIPANGFAIGVTSSIDGASGQAWTWDSGGTESFDINIGNQSVHGGALRTVTTAETGTTFQATMNGGGSRASMCVASWGN